MRFEMIPKGLVKGLEELKIGGRANIIQNTSLQILAKIQKIVLVI